MLSGSVYECMPACERKRVSVIAASYDTSDGHLSAHARFDDEAIALVDAGRGQVQMPQLVALEDVNARVIQHELRVELIDDRRQHESQPPLVLCISSATRQVLVPILRRGAGAWGADALPVSRRGSRGKGRGTRPLAPSRRYRDRLAKWKIRAAVETQRINFWLVCKDRSGPITW